jgi:hypothetical protein
MKWHKKDINMQAFSQGNLVSENILLASDGVGYSWADCVLKTKI